MRSHLALNVVLVGSAVLIASPGLAQTAPPPPTPAVVESQPQLLLNGNDGVGGSGSFLDLIRRAGQGGMDWETFRRNQQQNLNDAAARFRLQQQRRLGQPAAGTTVPPEPNTPSAPVAPAPTIQP